MHSFHFLAFEFVVIAHCFTLSSITPSYSPVLGGVNVTIAGNFGLINNPSVTIGQSYDCNVLQSENDQIVCSTSCGIGSQLDVVVSHRVGRFSTLAAAFSYQAPIMFGFQPTNGPNVPDFTAMITITGANFGPPSGCGISKSNRAVRVANQNCMNIKFASDTQVTCNVPTGSGLRNVITVEVGNQLATGTSLFAFDAPALYSASPDEGSEGTLVTITGTNFGSNSSDNLGIYVGSIQATSDITFLRQIDATQYVSFNIPSGLPTGNNLVQVVVGTQVNKNTGVSFYVVGSENGGLSVELAILLPCLIGFIFVIASVATLIWFKHRLHHYEGTRELLLDNSQLGTCFIDPRDIHLGRQLGTGSFGAVYEALWQGTKVAVKAISPCVAGEGLLDEAELLASLRHPNIVQLLGVVAGSIPNTGCSVAMVTELMELGSLSQLIYNLDKPLPWKLVRSVCLDTARGLAYLHNQNPAVLHRDLKSANLLVGIHYNVKIGDFGVARHEKSSTMTSVGTPKWTAPEVLRGLRYTEKADIFSFGVVIWELWSRCEPYEQVPAMQVVFEVATHGSTLSWMDRPNPEVHVDMHPELIELGKRCLVVDSESRPSTAMMMVRIEKMPESEDWIGEQKKMEKKQERILEEIQEEQEDEKR